MVAVIIVMGSVTVIIVITVCNHYDCGHYYGIVIRIITFLLLYYSEPFRGGQEAIAIRT